mgnify:CR=1 FL=1
MNSLTRLDNCELANEMKSMAAGKRQLEDIQWIENYKGLDALPVKLQNAAYARKAMPEASLLELCEYCEEQFDEETALQEFNNDSNALAIMQQISIISKKKKRT